MVRQKGHKPRLLPCNEPNFYAEDATQQDLHTSEHGYRAIFPPTSSTAGQDSRGLSSNLMPVKEVSPAATIIVSSSSTVAKSSFFVTPFEAIQKVRKIPRRRVGAEGSSIIGDSSSVSTSINDSDLVSDEQELYIPKSPSTPQQEVVRFTQNENAWVTEDEDVAINISTKRRPFSSFKNWIQQDYETIIGDFEGRKFFFVARCDNLENCVDIQ